MLTRILITWQSVGWFRMGICLPLCLAFWNAPLPWVHRHEESEAAAWELDTHLRMFHRERDWEHDAQDWHWHYAFLWQMMGCEEFPASEPPTHCVLVTGDDCPCPKTSDLSAQDVVERLLIQTVDLAAMEPCSEASDLPAIRAADRSGQFLTTFLSGATLRDLLCIARC